MFRALPFTRDADSITWSTHSIQLSLILLLLFSLSHLPNTAFSTPLYTNAYIYTHRLDAPNSIPNHPSSPAQAFIFFSLYSPMGNYVSCTLSSPITARHSRAAAKVIFPAAQIRQFYQPIKAAELMLETPNFFLVNSASLQIGRRFSALGADEDLEMANVYVMFPMTRLNSVVTAADLGALFLTANSAAKRIAGPNARVLPAAAADESPAVPKLNLDDIEEFSSPEFKHRLSMCRSKKPLLETIAEEPVCSR